MRKCLLISFVFVLSWMGITENLWARKLLSPYEASLSADGSQFILQTTDSTLAQVVVLHNKSSMRLLLNRIVPDNPGVSAGWSSEIDPDHWSALSWQKSRFILSCQEAISKEDVIWQTIPCPQVIELYKPIGSKNKSSSSYWVVENKTKVQLMARLVKLLWLQDPNNSSAQ